jgi:acetyltransferase EpsM
MIIYGASGHGLVILDILKKQGIHNCQFIDDFPKQQWIGGPILPPQEITYSMDQQAVVAVGANHVRKRITKKYEFDYQHAIHPNAIVAIPIENIGPGTVIMAGVVINPEVRIGCHAIINTSCSIDHECVLGDFVHVSPNATLCGNVKVGEGTHVGAGAVIIQGINIGKWATVGAGAVVIKDVPDFAVVVGNPARILRVNPSF